MQSIYKYGVTVAVLGMIHFSCSDDPGNLDASVDGGTADTIGDQHVIDGLPRADQQTTDGDSTTDSSNVCSSPLGSAMLQGTFKGNPLSATHAIGGKQSFKGETGYRISLWGQGGKCSDFPTVGGVPTLSVILCSSKKGTYAVGSTCAGASFKNEVNIPEMGVPPTYHQATSGTVTIDSLDSTCGGKIKGSFSVSFSGDKVSGTFDTVGCGTL